MKKKIFALSLATAILGMTAACTTARTDNTNAGSMAGNGIREENTASGDMTPDSTITNTHYTNTAVDEYRLNTTDPNRNQSVTEADNLNESDNGVILDDSHTAIDGAVRDAARGVVDLADDLTDGTGETGISGTDTFR